MTILLLAGTSEGKRIAMAAADLGLDLVASLAGATRHPDPLPVPTRVGGFGGDDGFRAYLAAHRITAVLDATHPFAARISDRSARICAKMGLPYLQVMRPPWTAEYGDRWTMITTSEEAAAHIPTPATVFLATGRQSLPAFANLEGRRVLLRLIDPPTEPFPFEGGEFIISRPPFSLQRECDLFRDLGVTHLVVKNSGGTAGRTKLDAAGALSIPVVMVQRPASGPAARVETVAQAVDWLRAL